MSPADNCFEEGSENPGTFLSGLLFAENSDVLVSVPGIRERLQLQKQVIQL